MHIEVTLLIKMQDWKCSSTNEGSRQQDEAINQYLYKSHEDIKKIIHRCLHISHNNVYGDDGSHSHVFFGQMGSDALMTNGQMWTIISYISRYSTKSTRYVHHMTMA